MKLQEDKIIQMQIHKKKFFPNVNRYFHHCTTHVQGKASSGTMQCAYTIVHNEL